MTRRLPAAADVVVIGGGLTGLWSALELARRGQSVVVLEKGALGGEASGRAFGLVSELLLDPIKAEISALAKALWAEEQARSGDLTFRQEGVSFFAATRAEMGHFEGWARGSRTGARLLGPREVSDRWDGPAGRWQGAISLDSDGGVEPALATQHLAGLARDAGAVIVENCAVRQIETVAGRICGVTTEAGAIRADRVICAANLWARWLCQDIGIDLPLLYVVKTLGRIAAIPGGPAGAGGTSAGAWRRQIDGRYTVAGNDRWTAPVTPDSFRLLRRFLPMLAGWGRSIRLETGPMALRAWRRASAHPSAYEAERVFRAGINPAHAERALQSLARDFRAFAGAGYHEIWAGAVAMTPDNLPVVSAVPARPGLFVVSAGGYGVTWAPALGRSLARLACGEVPGIDLAPFDIGRFASGRRLPLYR